MKRGHTEFVADTRAGCTRSSGRVRIETPVRGSGSHQRGPLHRTKSVFTLASFPLIYARGPRLGEHHLSSFAVDRIAAIASPIAQREVTVEGSAGDAQTRPDVLDAVRFVLVQGPRHGYFRRRSQLLRSAAHPPARPRGGESGLRPEEVKVRLTPTRHIDLLTVATQYDKPRSRRHRSVAMPITPTSAGTGRASPG